MPSPTLRPITAWVTPEERAAIHAAAGGNVSAHARLALKAYPGLVAALTEIVRVGTSDVDGLPREDLYGVLEEMVDAARSALPAPVGRGGA